VTLSGGTASVTLTAGTTTPLTTEGTFTITAAYSGSPQVAPPSVPATDSFNVVKATPTVAVTNNGPVVVGASVTLTADVSAAVATDGGTVTFRVGTTAIGTSVVGGTITPACGGGTNATGQAKCVAATGTGTALPTAKNSPYTVTADYAATTQVASGSGTTSVALNKTGPTVSITGGTGSFALGSAVTFTVNVTGNCGSGNTSSCPTGGTVGLFVNSLTSTPFATATVSGNTATFTAITTGAGTFANAGTYTIFAQFNGDATNGNVAAANTSGTLTLAPVTATVTVTGPTTGTASTSFNFTATVTPNYSPSGTVQFKDGTTNLGSAVTLSGNTAQITGVTLAAGTHTITVVFTDTSGNYNNTPTYVALAVVVS
jgi:hypothetical protein